MTTDQATSGNALPLDSPRGAERWLLPGILIALASVVAIFGTFTTWVNVQALDTDEWVKLSSELLDKPEIQEALSAYLIDELYRELDVTAAVEEMLPEDLDGLAGPLSGVFRGPATAGLERIIDSDAFESKWVEINRVAHQTLVDALRDETRSGLTSDDGTVTLELGELVRSVGENLGLSASLLDQLPDDAGRIVVFESDELENAQKAVQVLDFLGWSMFVAIVVLYAAAVYFSPGQRVIALGSVGRSLLAVGIIVLIARVLVARFLIDAIIDDPGTRSIAKLISYVGTGLLRQIGWSAVSYGIVIMLFAALFSDNRWAVSSRRALAPALNASAGALVAGTTVGLLALLWWSPGRVFEGWSTGLVFVAMIICAVVTLRVRVGQEFPGVTVGDLTRSIKTGFGSVNDSV